MIRVLLIGRSGGGASGKRANCTAGGGASGVTAGGAPPYTYSLLLNSSGATINAATGAYTAGATGSVSDTVRVQDSLGATSDAIVTVTAGDHAFRLVIDGQAAGVVPRTTTSEIHRYKAYAAHPRPGRR